MIKFSFGIVIDIKRILQYRVNIEKKLSNNLRCYNNLASWAIVRSLLTLLFYIALCQHPISVMGVVDHLWQNQIKSKTSKKLIRKIKVMY